MRPGTQSTNVRYLERHQTHALPMPTARERENKERLPHEHPQTYMQALHCIARTHTAALLPQERNRGRHTTHLERSRQLVGGTPGRRGAARSSWARWRRRPGRRWHSGGVRRISVKDAQHTCGWEIADAAGRKRAASRERSVQRNSLPRTRPRREGASDALGCAAVELHET